MRKLNKFSILEGASKAAGNVLTKVCEQKLSKYEGLEQRNLNGCVRPVCQVSAGLGEASIGEKYSKDRKEVTNISDKGCKWRQYCASGNQHLYRTNDAITNEQSG